MATELSTGDLAALAEKIASSLFDRMERQAALLDYQGLAAWLGISVASAERLKRQGRIPFLAAGRRVLFDRAAVSAALSMRGPSDDQI